MLHNLTRLRVNSTATFLAPPEALPANPPAPAPTPADFSVIITGPLDIVKIAARPLTFSVGLLEVTGGGQNPRGKRLRQSQ